MRRSLQSIAASQLPLILLAVALGSAAASFADQVADVAVSIVVQHLTEPVDRSFFEILGTSQLNFTVAGTTIFYGVLLSPAVALGLLVTVAWLVVRQAGGGLTPCAFCASRIPVAAMRCPICGSRLEPAET